MASLNDATDRHPTPPLSPSTSSGSSHASSASASSSSPLSLILQRKGTNLRATRPRPGSLRLEHCDPISKPGLVTDSTEEDTMMLDDWGEVGHERPEGLHVSPPPDRSKGRASFESPAKIVSFPFQLEPTPSHESRFSIPPQQEAQLQSGFSSPPLTDVIDVANLVRPDQPLLVYQNMDETLSSNTTQLTARASRPLPIPVPDRHNSSTSVHSTRTTNTSETTKLPPSLVPNTPDTIFSTSRPISPLEGSSQSLVGSLGQLHSHNSCPSQDLIDSDSVGIHTSPTSMSFNALPRHAVSSESNPQTVPSDLFDHLSWVKNQSSSSTQQATLAVPVSSRPISSPGLIQSHTQSPSYSPPLASSSRNVGRPFSEHAADMRCTCHPPPAEAVLTSRGLPPPAPPTILDPPPAREHSARNFRAPYEPFLSDAPPPPDSWIAVETSQADYRLNVRLPGFRRDAITLAAGRRRILHVVADSWEPGGGHFERRISFGYDADLSRVRAEFDGEILRVTVPRRAPALTWYGEACE